MSDIIDIGEVPDRIHLQITNKECIKALKMYSIKFDRTMANAACRLLRRGLAMEDIQG